MGKPKITMATDGSDLLDVGGASPSQGDGFGSWSTASSVTTNLPFFDDDGRRLTIDTDLAALKTFSSLAGHELQMSCPPTVAPTLSPVPAAFRRLCSVFQPRHARRTPPPPGSPATSK